MDAELSQRTAVLMQSPYFKAKAINIDALINRLSKSREFDNLSTQDKQLFQLGEKSIQIAENLGISGADYTPENLQKIIARMNLTKTNQPFFDEDSEPIEIDFGV